MIEASKIKKCPVCGIGKRKHENRSTQTWWNHINACLKYQKKYKSGCNCGKMEADFETKSAFIAHTTYCGVKGHQPSRPSKNHAATVTPKEKGIECNCGRTASDFNNNRNAFGGHVRHCGLKDQPVAIKRKTVAVEKPFKCPECPREFPTESQLKSHSWIHRRPKAGKEWGDKDAIRRSLQTIAAARLQRLPFAKRVAICLPGNRPDHEEKLLADPGFSRIHMVECIEDKCIAATKKGFDVEHGDFLEVMMDLVNQGTRLALIDYDLCGTLSYADGSTILEAIRAGGLADIAAVRVTCCRRNYKRSGELDIAALDRDIFGALPPGYGVTGKSWNFYVGKDRSSMATQQWLIEKGA